MDWVAVVSCLTAWLLFANTWNGDFVYDDSRAIVNNEDLRQTTPWLQLWRDDFWGTPLNHAGSHQSWRPFCVISFRFNFYFSGLNAKSYHLVNATMHSIATLCLALLMRPLLQKKREWIRLAAALAFAAHPIHCEAVASVVGRAELGHTLHTLLALLAYRNHLIARKEEEDVEHSSSTNGGGGGGGLLLSLQQLMHRVVSTICCCCYPSSSSSSNTNKTKRKKKEEETLLEASSSSVRRERHHEHLLPSSSTSSGMGGAKSMLYLTSSCCLAWTAILWKENGIMALPLCAIMELMASAITCSSRSGSSSSTSTGVVVHTQTQWKNLALVGLLSASQVTVRLLMLGGGGGPWFAAADNPVARDSSILTRTCTFFYLPVFNALLLLWPSALSFDWSMDAISPVQSLTDVRNLVSITFYAALIALGLKAFGGGRRKNPLLILALALLILPFIPASNLFFYVGFVVAERVLYLPSAGYCLLLAVGLDRLFQRHQRRRSIIQLSFLITVCFWSFRTLQRNADWTSEERLYRSAIDINPAKAYGNMAAILARDGHRQVEAEHAYRQALTYRPNMAETHFNLALLLQTQGRYQEASSSYLQAIRYRPNLAAAHLNLGQLLGKQGRYDEAIHWLAACTQLDSSASVRDPQSHRHSQIQALILWGQMELAVRQQPARAVQLYKQALRRSPTNPQQLEAVYEALGEAYQVQGDVHESERWLRKAVDVDHAAVAVQEREREQQSSSSAALLTYARFLAKNASRHDEAEQLFRQAQRIAPHDPVVYMLTGQFLLDVSRKREAADAFVQAALLAPDDFEAVFNAAATLRELKDLQRAEHYYRRAVQLRPDDVIVYRNLGALLHLQGRWNEAEDNYKLALHLSPDDKTTLINMQRLHHAINSQRQQQQQQQQLQRNDSH